MSAGTATQIVRVTTYYVTSWNPFFHRYMYCRLLYSSGILIQRARNENEYVHTKKTLKYKLLSKFNLNVDTGK